MKMFCQPFPALLLAFLCSCSPAALVRVTVSSAPGMPDRRETVELRMTDLQAVSGKVVPGAILVRGKDGSEVPFQIYEEYDGTSVLVFTADVAAGRKSRYCITEGRTPDYPMKAYGRHVPERRDDYAFENDLIAGRVYGPSLKSPRTLGLDIWTKSTDRLVIDERFASGHYHKNYGDGMDCYKVGRTLGGGALAPLDSEGKIVTGDNWSEVVHITDGPVRTKARFVNGPFNVDGRPVKIIREMSLDAGSYFVCWETVFVSDCDSLNVALAAVMHDTIAVDEGKGWVCFEEKASDSKQPDVDGNIFVAIVMDSDVLTGGMQVIDGHAALKSAVATGQITRSWTGSAWSHASVRDENMWKETVRDFSIRQSSPLKIRIRKR